MPNVKKPNEPQPRGAPPRRRAPVRRPLDAVARPAGSTERDLAPSGASVQTSLIPERDMTPSGASVQTYAQALCSARNLLFSESSLQTLIVEAAESEPTQKSAKNSDGSPRSTITLMMETLSIKGQKSEQPKEPIGRDPEPISFSAALDLGIQMADADMMDLTEQKEDYWSTLPRTTPSDFTHHWLHRHPMAPLVNPRQTPWKSLTESDIVLEIWNYNRHIDGFGTIQKLKEQFPHINVDKERGNKKICFLELPGLVEAIGLRERTEQEIERMKAEDWKMRDVKCWKLQTGSNDRTLLPAERQSEHKGTPYRPVFYQMINKGFVKDGAILRACDILVPGEDRGDLSTIVLDQNAVNIVTGGRGFNFEETSVRDYFWVYDLEYRHSHRGKCTDQQFEDVKNVNQLSPPNTIFWRVKYFCCLPHIMHPRPRLGMIIKCHKFPVKAEKRDYRKTSQYNPRNRAYAQNLKKEGAIQTVELKKNKKVQAAFEGSPEPVQLSPGLFGGKDSKEWNSLEEYMVVQGNTRVNASTSLRCSEPPSSTEALHKIIAIYRSREVYRPEQGLSPSSVKVLPQDQDVVKWINNMLSGFSLYRAHPGKGNTFLANILNLTSSVLAADERLKEDIMKRPVTMNMDLTQCKIRLSFTIKGIRGELGWSSQRTFIIWPNGMSGDFSAVITKATWHEITGQTTGSMEIEAEVSNPAELMKLFRRYNKPVEGILSLDGLVRLKRMSSLADPAYQILSHNNLFKGAKHRRRLLDILRSIYGTSWTTPRNDRPPPQAHVVEGKQLTVDQCRAVDLILSGVLIGALQAAPGTGKTLIACYATCLAAKDGKLVIMTSTTNFAVARCAEGLEHLQSFSDDIRPLRYVSDAHRASNIGVKTKYDIQVFLEALGTLFKVTTEEYAAWEEYINKKEHIKQLTESGQLVSEDERRAYLITEKEVGEAHLRRRGHLRRRVGEAHLLKMVKILLENYKPNVFLGTTAAILNITAPGATFADLAASANLTIADEASQMPKPVGLALVDRLEHTSLIMVGDNQQLPPHVELGHDTLPVKLGARSFLEVLLHSGAPREEMITSFRAHPGLTQLISQNFYQGTLRSALSPSDRATLLEKLRKPLTSTPIFVVETRGDAQRSVTGSYFNQSEAVTAVKIVENLRLLGYEPSQIAVICFYQQQRRDLLETSLGDQINILTIDSAQSQNFDVVLLLTTRNLKEASDFMKKI